MSEQGRELEDWITTSEAAAMLGRTQRRVEQLIVEGKLIARDIHPRLKLVYKPSVLEYLRGESKADGQ